MLQVLQPPKFGNFTNYRDILRPYEIGIGAYSKVNIKYINPLTYELFFVIFLYTIDKNILGLQLSQIGMCTLVDLTMKLIKLTLQGPLYPETTFLMN
jgi:hypothetical protein